MKRLYYTYLYGEGVCGVGTYLEMCYDFFRTKQEYRIHFLLFNSPENRIIDSHGDSCKIIEVCGSVAESVKYLRDSGIIHDTCDDIFIQNFSPAGSLIKTIKTVFPRCKTIYVIHDLIWLSYVRGDVEKYFSILSQGDDKTVYYNGNERRNLVKFFSALYHDCCMACREADGVVCLNPDTVDLLTYNFNIDSSKIYFIRNGLTESRYKGAGVRFHHNRCIHKIGTSEHDDLEMSGFRILYAGRFTSQKGFDILSEVFEKLCDAGLNLQLICCGEGAPFGFFKKACSRSRIKYLGIVPAEELYRLMESSDVGIMPSRYEQCGYFAVELMMVGVPVIVSDGFGISDLAAGGACLTFKNGDSDSLADRIKQIYHMNATERQRLAELSVHDYECRYSLSLMGEKYSNLFNSI